MSPSRKMVLIPLLPKYRDFMQFDRASLYKSIKPLFAAHLNDAIDIQSDFAERLQIVATCEGRKPAFMAVVEDAHRKQLFAKLSKVLPTGIRHGFNRSDIHHRYRQLNIRDAALAAAFEERAIEKLPIFWIGSGEAADYYEGARGNSLSDDLSLGYPRCCAAWHYDCYFARGPEAFAEVTALDGKPDMPDWVRENWRSRPGFFLPARPLTVAVLRGNHHFPFLDHVACPRCISDDDSPSARLNADYSMLADEVDPECANAVRLWCTKLRPKIDDYCGDFGREIKHMAEMSTTTVRAYDAYQKHSRHLLKALNL